MTAVRLGHLLGLAARLQWRHGLVAVIAALTVAWTAILLALPAATARAVAPWLLLLETALLGTTLAGALVLLDRSQGMLAALATSPARSGDYLTSTLGTLTGLVLGSAAAIALAGRIGAADLLPVLVAVGLTAALAMLVSVVVAARAGSAITFMVGLPLVLLPLLVPALLHGAGLGNPLLYAVPTTGAMAVVQAGFESGSGLPASGAGAALGWLALGCVPVAALARDQLRRFASGPPSPRRPAASPPPTHLSRPLHSHPGGAPARSGAPRSLVAFRHGPRLLGADLARLRRDPLLILIGLSSVLLAAGVRFGYPPLHRWLGQAYELDLTSYRPLLLAAVILLPAHTFGMVGALLVLDDADDRALVALRTSPLTLPRYLGYRTALVTAVALAGTIVTGTLSGLATAAPWPQFAAAGLLAALVAPLFMLGTLAVARNKVAGIGAIKLLGLPMFAPLGAWWLTGPAGWWLAPLPTWWVAQALWNSWTYALVGAGLLAGALVLLSYRVASRLADRARAGW